MGLNGNRALRAGGRPPRATRQPAGTVAVPLDEELMDKRFPRFTIEQPVGWTNDRGEWLCETCYVAYVAPRSIDFVAVE
jgi:hypothetical protein